jgi:hypothetical protein
MNEKTLWNFVQKNVRNFVQKNVRNFVQKHQLAGSRTRSTKPEPIQLASPNLRFCELYL